MEFKKVLEEIYEAGVVNVTVVYKGNIIIDNMNITTDVVDDYGNSAVISSLNDTSVGLEGELSYDEELGYVFTNNDLKTYIEII